MLCKPAYCNKDKFDMGQLFYNTDNKKNKFVTLFAFVFSLLPGQV